MPKRLKENLDYTFSYKDLITADKMVRKYISDREKMYNELFNSEEDYNVDDLKEYLEYFEGASASDLDVDAQDSKHHKYLWSIREFLSRNYEFNLLPNYCDLIGNVSDCLFYLDELADNITDEGMDDIVETEYECIENLKKFWNDYIVAMANYPLMDLSKLNKTCILGCEVLFDKSTDDFVLNSFLEFLQNIKKDFPQTLRNFDKFLILPNEFLTFLADGDEQTQAFFTDGEIYLKCKCDNLSDPSEQLFYKCVLYHEFSHYLWTLLPQYLQQYWVESYKEWKNKGLKLTRADDRNSQKSEFMQELFADCNACRYLGDKLCDEDYIHNPSPIIMDTFNFILKKAFEIKGN